jgi:hypothetical protein
MLVASKSISDIDTAFFLSLSFSGNVRNIHEDKKTEQYILLLYDISNTEKK